MDLPGRSALVDAPLDAGGLAREVADRSGGRAGAQVTFTGLVRADRVGALRVRALEFEAYPEMAAAELERIRVEAGRRHGLVACSVLHRLGAVAVGAPSVVVVAAAAHRAEAFQAAAWVMDEVKRRLPVWKRAVDGGGGRTWVDAQGPR